MRDGGQGIGDAGDHRCGAIDHRMGMLPQRQGHGEGKRKPAGRSGPRSLVAKGEVLAVPHERTHARAIGHDRE